MEISFIPKYIINRIVSNNDIKVHCNILFSNLIILLLFSSNYVFLINQIPHYCLVDYIFGIPCPGCGITGGIIEITNFNPTIKIMPLLVLSIIVAQIALRLIAISYKNYSTLIINISKYIDMFFIFTLVLNYIFINLRS